MDSFRREIQFHETEKGFFTMNIRWNPRKAGFADKT